MKLPRFFRSRIASFSILTVLIGTVLVGIALLAIGYKILVGSSALNEQQKCRLSILAADQASSLKRSTVGAVEMTPNLDCDAQEVVIHANDVRRSRRGRIDDDLVKGKIATVLKDCWSRVGAGELNPFKESLMESASDPFGAPTYCMVCSKVRFGDDFQREASEQDYQIEGLNYWMATRRIPGKENSFYEYVFGRKPSVEELEQMREHPDRYSLDSEYVVVWRLSNYDPQVGAASWVVAGAVGGGVAGSFIPLVGTAVGAGIGAAAGVAVGFGAAIAAGLTEESVVQGVFILPPERLSGKLTREGKNDVCTIMVN